MANAYTDTTALANLVETAYDQYVEFALRAQPLFRSLADKRPEQQSMPGSSVVFDIYNDFAPATGTLTEDVDPDAVAFPETTTVTVTLEEYGNSSIATRRLRVLALSNIDPALVDAIAYNQADSIDGVVQTVLRGGTNVIHSNGGAVTYNSGTTVGTTSTDVFSSEIARLARTKLVKGKAVPVKGGLYACYLDPDASHDLRAETGAGGWRTPHEYSDAAAIWAGEIGAYEGHFFVETPRAYSDADGASSATVYRSYFMGKQALAEACAEEFHVVVGPVVDKLKRFQPIGWTGIAGWSVYRQAALVRAETASSAT